MITRNSGNYQSSVSRDSDGGGDGAGAGGAYVKFRISAGLGHGRLRGLGLVNQAVSQKPRGN